MSDARYSRQRPRKGPQGPAHNGGVSVESLAVALRRAGAQRVHRDIALPRLEQQLGRSLSASERDSFRQAWAMAQDSRVQQDGAKRTANVRQAGIVRGGQVIHPSTSKGRAATRDQRRPIGADAGGKASHDYHRLWRAAQPAPRDGRNRWSFDPTEDAPWMLTGAKQPTVKELDFLNYRKRSASK